ncbi:MAG: EamA family transporter [Solirubrobacterales bacterium]
MPDWLPFAVAFAACNGALSITIKLAIPQIAWTQVVHWSTLAYMVTSLIVIVAGGWTLQTAGWGWGILFGFLAAGGLIFLFLALERGDASLVVPIGASYPVVTAILAALFLTETITPLRAAGIVLVVAGAMVIGRESVPDG